MTVHLPPRNEKGEALDVSYCSACMICKANGYCYQNQDYDELVMGLKDADTIIVEPLPSDGPALDRLLHPEQTWFPKRRIAFLRDCYAAVRGTVVVRDAALLVDVRNLFINATVTGGEKDA